MIQENNASTTLRKRKLSSGYIVNLTRMPNGVVAIRPHVEIACLAKKAPGGEPAGGADYQPR
jgi:hypothetical protein